MPVLLTQDGAAADPTVTVIQRYGEQTEVEEISSDQLIWRVRGPDSRQPSVEISYRAWSPEYDIKIEGTFGSIGLSQRIPLRVQQCLIGLVRWHSLHYGQGPDEARDAATLNRITSENSRDRSVTYHDSAISPGLTGDPVIDRILAEYTVQPGPWTVRGGDAS